MHEQWAGAQARIITLEEQGTALRQELAAWEEREARRRERRRVEQRVELQEKRQRQEQRRQEEEEKKVSSTKPFSPTSPGELLEESRLRCAAAEAQVRALEGRLKQQQAAKEALAKEAEAAARGLAAEREHTAVLLGERNGFRQRADSLARELSRVATRSLSQSLSLAQQQEGQGQQQQQQQRVPRSFDEAVAQLAQAQAEAQRLREELEELKALGTVAFTASSSTGTVAAPAASGGDNSTNSSSKNAERLPSSLRAMAAGALRRRKSSGGLSTIFRLPSQGEEGSPLTLPSPLPRSERARSGSGYADSGREAEMLQLLRSLTKSVQDKEAERLRAARRLERVEALARGAGMVVPPEEEGGVRVEEGRQEKAVVLMTADV